MAAVGGNYHLLPTVHLRANRLGAGLNSSFSLLITAQFLTIVITSHKKNNQLIQRKPLT